MAIPVRLCFDLLMLDDEQMQWVLSYSDDLNEFVRLSPEFESHVDGTHDSHWFRSSCDCSDYGAKHLILFMASNPVMYIHVGLHVSRQDCRLRRQNRSWSGRRKSWPQSPWLHKKAEKRL